MKKGHNVAMTLRAAYLAMHQEADIALRPYRVTANQFVVLSVLNDEDGITQRALVDRVTSDANSIRPVLASLEEKKYVLREPHPSDGRAWSVRITRKGRSAFTKMQSGTNSFRKRLVNRLSNTETETLIELLRRLEASMQDRVGSCSRHGKQAAKRCRTLSK